MYRLREHGRLGLVLLLVACAASNLFGREQSGEKHRDVDPKTGMIFPARLGIFERERGIEYDDGGYPMATYLAGRLILASVFYDKNAPFAAEYGNARDAVKIKTPTARLISDGASNLHPAGRRALFTFDDTFLGGPKIKLMSELMMFPHRDYYLTFRITYAAAHAERARQEIDSFVKACRLP